MLSARKVPKKVRGETPEDLDLPVAVRDQFTINRLGDKEDHLFLLDARDAIVVTAVETRYRYFLPFSYCINKIELYQTDNVGAESADALNIRIEALHPSNVPSVIYNKQGVSWGTGQSTLTGRRFMPAGEVDVVVDGTATNLLYFSLEVTVFNVA